jgi:hypothetical protein
MYDVLALSNSQEFATADIFFGFTMTEEQKWFNELLIYVRSAWQTRPIEVLGPGLFTLQPLRLIARKLAILILTLQNVIRDTSLGCDNSVIKVKFTSKF